MGILIDRTTRVLIQGITGKEGLKSAISTRDYQTPVLAGVTPGKGGTVVEGFPVYNTVAEALAAHPDITCSVLYVPASAVFDAGLEALEAGIRLITIVTEHVPVHDVAKLLSVARDRGARIVGPSSIGIITPGQAKVGSIGGFTPQRAYSPGPIGIISKSGGMCSEIASMLSRLGLGQSTVIGIGGDRLVGTTYADLLPLFENDPQTEIVVLYGEIGGTYEHEAASLLRHGSIRKPLVVCVSGLFAEMLPAGLSLGHAGAIIEGREGGRQAKIQALQAAGAHVATTSDEIPTLCQNILARR